MNPKLAGEPQASAAVTPGRKGRHFWFFCSIFTALALCVTSVVWALVDDAHTMAMEIAVPDVKDGFDVREDYWSGGHEAGKTIQVRLQLFKGNDYAFWVATDDESAKIDRVALLDEDGNEVKSTIRSQGHMAALKVKPSATGSYKLQFSYRGTGKFSWAVAYGFH